MIQETAKPSLISFDSRGALAARLADLLETALACGVLGDGQAELAVSGGMTPKATYENLATRERLPWDRINVTLVDERWVPSNHPSSNEAFVRAAFSKADGVRISGLYNGAASAEEGVSEIAERLNGRNKPYDAVILGMGDDGHTASWFPYADGLNRALESNAQISAITAKKNDITGEEVERMTFTLSTIRDARLIILLIAGESKRNAFEKALAPGPVEAAPVRAILRARPDLWVCWAP